MIIYICYYIIIILCISDIINFLCRNSIKMKVYPKSEHLKISMICCSLLGIFPWQFMFEDNKCLQKLYALFSKLMLSYYIMFLMRAYMQLYLILKSEGLKMDAISANMCITLIYTITITRQLIMKLSSGFRNIVKQIIESEKYIDSIGDKEVKEIYDNCAKDTQQKTKVYLYVLCMITTQYIVRPTLIEPYREQVGNETIVIKPLPLSSWFPFNEQEHYLAAYMWSILDSLVGASFVTYTDIFMFNLIVFPTGQLRILQHRLEKFDDYKQRFIEDQDEDVAAYVTFVDLISQHKKIIKYIQNFNNTMSALMVFDFLQSSLQIATILTQVLGNEITLILIVFVGTFFVGMVLRLILYYYYANEVILLSQGLADSLWKSNWYEQPPSVKFMMFIFIMRAQKPLRFHIGPFSDMSLTSFIAILKASYSYIMLMYGVN